MFRAMTNLFAELVANPDWFTVGEGDDEVVRLRPGIDPRSDTSEENPQDGEGQHEQSL